MYNSTKNIVAEKNECFIKNISASTLVSTGPGTLVGITVNSHTSGIVGIADGTVFANGSLMHSSITLASGERTIDFSGERFSTGLFVQIGGTADITVRYR